MSNILSNRNLLGIAKSYSIHVIESQRKAKEGLTTEIFFDAFDVIKIIQGIGALENSLRINTSEVNKTSTLVHSLAYKGWLGKINLLAPHQDEVIDNLQIKSHIFPNRIQANFDDLINDFIYKLNLTPLLDRLAEGNPKELAEHINNVKVHGIQLFNANYYLKELFWFDRYKYLFKKSEILSFDDSAYGTEDILDTELFRQLRIALNDNRSHRSKSNLFDAIALCLLQKKLEKHIKSSTENPLPIFYASSHSILRAIQRVRKINPNWFSYKYEENFIPITRNSDFFVLDSIFTIESTVSSFNGFLVELQETQKEIKHIVDKLQPNIESGMLKLGNEKADMAEEINDLLKVEFFKKIWFNNGGYEELHHSLANAMNFSTKHQDEVEKYIFTELAEIEEKFSKNIEKYRTLKSLWVQLYEFKNYIESNLKKINSDFQIIKDFGLVRFPIGGNINKKISQLFDDLISSFNEKRFKDFDQILSFLVNLLYTGIYDKNHDNLLLGLGLLWIFEKYKLIVEICDKLNFKYPSISIALIHASAHYFKSIPDKNKILKTLNFVEKSEANYKNSIGLSYVYFRIWQQVVEPSLLPEMGNSSDKHKTVKKEGFKYFDKAINHLTSALQFLETTRNSNPDKTDERNKKYFYALNNYIYYTTIGASSDEFEKISEFQSILEGGETNQELWQSRFYDTLALYQIRRALLTNKENAFRFHLKRAKRLNMQSLENINMEQNKINYEKMKNIIEELLIYGHKKQNK